MNSVFKDTHLSFWLIHIYAVVYTVISVSKWKASGRPNFVFTKLTKRERKREADIYIGSKYMSKVVSSSQGTVSKRTS